MSAVTQPLLAEAAQPDLQAILDIQRNAFHSEGEVTHAVRVDRLKRLKSFIVENKKAFASTTKREYGDERSYEFSLFSEYASKVEAIDYSIKHLKAWMKPVRRKANKPMNFLGGSSRVRYFPKGLLASSRPGISRSD